MPRVCRVAPDVTAVERVFDYVVPDALAPLVRVGAIVRVPLHGRRVRGWVVADDGDARDRGATARDPRRRVATARPPTSSTLDRVDRLALAPAPASPSSAPPHPPTASRPSPNTRTGVADAARRCHDRRRFADRGACAGAAVARPAGAGRVDVRRRRVDDRRGGRRVAGPRRSRSTSGAPAARSRSCTPTTPTRERTLAWRRAAQGSCVVVGGRIAALAPVPDLAAAIVVDDADEALQEERSPTWHARDVLHERAARAGAPWSVVSPAPTVEALAIDGVELDEQPADVESARLAAHARGRPPRGAAGRGPVERGVGRRAARRRRPGRVRAQPPRAGSASLACDSCHSLLRWDRAADRPMLCDECGATRAARAPRGRHARARGAGGAVPAPARARRRRRHRTTSPEADILIGTEAVLHRPEVRRRRPALVAFLDFDQELLAPRYRAVAQAHWLVTRGAQLLVGRPRARDAARGADPPARPRGRARARRAAGPRSSRRPSSSTRRALGFPPFGALAELTGDDEAVQAAAGTRCAVRCRSRCTGPPTGARSWSRRTPTRWPTRSQCGTPRAGRSAASAPRSTRARV